MLADGRFGDDQLPGDGGVGVPFGDQRQHLSFPGGQPGQRVAVPAHELPHHFGVDDRAPGHHAAQCHGELRHVDHSVFQQVADPQAVAGVEQVGGVALLHVLAESDDSQARPGVAELAHHITST